ncbi:TPA: hypothetical protein I2T90_04865 [Staphylococcus aureus]|nr:hypothetical protein CU118_01115 [Staphylococcus aureus]MSN55973.1 hypothetical protein [Staphylococcus aureus]MSN61866.1 hypothetical protein [Staphylococcus aureus]MSN64286.1 hypothetical protein [Staphylococcus aureus]MSN69005.1 hypothetical protein [Staphylococcus aureus]
MAVVDCGAPTQRISKRNSTDNASWRGHNTEAGGKSAYNNVQVGVGRRFCENIISVSLPIKVSLSHYYKSDECVNLWQIIRHPIFYRI